ncbi:MAG: hypothetical protein QXF50_01665 [Sulfolobales archaeon]
MSSSDVRSDYSMNSRRVKNLRISSVRGITLEVLRALSKYGDLSLRDLERILGIDYRILNVYLWRMRRYGLIRVSKQHYYYYYQITQTGLEVLKIKSEEMIQTHIGSFSSYNTYNTYNTYNRFLSDQYNRFSSDHYNTYNTYNTNNTYNRSFSSDQYNTYNTNSSDQYNTYNRYNRIMYNTNNRINLDPRYVNLFVNYVKNRYNLSDEEVVVVVGMVVNLLRSGCRRKYLRFSDSYQMEEFFGVRGDDLREVIRVLENKGIVYVYHDRSTIKIGLMRGFVEEIEREIGVCR